MVGGAGGGGGGDSAQEMHSNWAADGRWAVDGPSLMPLTSAPTSPLIDAAVVRSLTAHAQSEAARCIETSGGAVVAAMEAGQEARKSLVAAEAALDGDAARNARRAWDAAAADIVAASSSTSMRRLTVLGPSPTGDVALSSSAAASLLTRSSSAAAQRVIASATPAPQLSFVLTTTVSPATGVDASFDPFGPPHLAVEVTAYLESVAIEVRSAVAVTITDGVGGVLASSSLEIEHPVSSGDALHEEMVLPDGAAVRVGHVPSASASATGVDSRIGISFGPLPTAVPT